MTVTSLLFFACAIAAAFVYRRLPAKWRLPWLLLVSAGFLATWSWQFIPVLAVFAWVNFAIGKKADPANMHARAWTRAGIVFNVLFLFLLKYNNFYIDEFSRLLQRLGWLAPGSLLTILLPVGLSFLMVQAISYLLDVVNKRLKPESDFLRFMVYVFYFPKLLSGPVERARIFMPRLNAALPFDRTLAERSAALVLTGLFRKLVFANPLFNMIPPQAFLTPREYPGQLLFFWLLAYAFALYNDFAGYTAIIRGVSLWFGIELSPNFNLPYLSRNFTEFWTRWHISLSNWLRDYIFFPLSRSMMKRVAMREHFVNIVLPPMVTLLVSGMWHGLSWNMLVWGGLHGLYLIFERVWGLIFHAPPLDERPRWRQSLGTALTFVLAALAWLPFRMTLPAAWAYLTGLFHWSMPKFAALAQTLSGSKLISDWSGFQLPNPILLIVLAGAVVFDLLQNKGKDEEFVLRWSRLAQVLFVLVLLGVALLAFFSDTTAPFVYQAF
jgi:D-alanyl-lipoteichoic acid acyltransferase DltB (MBOAT superfamily)